MKKLKNAKVPKHTTILQTIIWCCVDIVDISPISFITIHFNEPHTITVPVAISQSYSAPIENPRMNNTTNTPPVVLMATMPSLPHESSHNRTEVCLGGLGLVAGVIAVVHSYGIQHNR